MKITHESMLELTKNMPMKLISIEKKIHLNSEMASINGQQIVVSNYDAETIPYLERYYAGTLRDGADLWFHRFLTNDSERHLHSHPFNFRTIMLCGGYTEEFLTPAGEKDFRVTLPDMHPINFNMLSYFSKNSIGKLSSEFVRGREIDVFDWHRIAVVEPDTWTMMIVQPERLPAWFFKDDDGELKHMKSSPKEWWHDFSPRID